MFITEWRLCIITNDLSYCELRAKATSPLTRIRCVCVTFAVCVCVHFRPKCVSYIQWCVKVISSISYLTKPAVFVDFLCEGVGDILCIYIYKYAHINICVYISRMRFNVYTEVDFVHLITASPPILYIHVHICICMCICIGIYCLFVCCCFIS